MLPSDGTLARVVMLVGLLIFPLLVLTQKLRMMNAERFEGYAAACTLELSYENPRNLAQTSSCDVFPHERKCDVYFKICMSTPGTEDCDVYRHTTEVFFERSSVNMIGEKAVIAFLSEPVPVSRAHTFTCNIPNLKSVTD
ncbi:unnamed protein product [Dibothriocephalus latus]|uniref:Uncharacterized protein n=1 Tax=Dibothriocephalus latus TaxID=60516 RepID=A0A3P7NMD8_DIBLA|nr:unnamed protein product [Dibothriocephalus latus]